MPTENHIADPKRSDTDDHEFFGADLIRFIAFAIIVVVFVWFISTMRAMVLGRKAKKRASRGGAETAEGVPKDPFASSKSWANKAQTARPVQNKKADIIDIDPLRSARDAQEPATPETPEGK